MFHVRAGNEVPSRSVCARLHLKVRGKLLRPRRVARVQHSGEDEIFLLRAKIRPAECFKALRPEAAERAGAEGNPIINRVHGGTQFIRMEGAHEHAHARFSQGWSREKEMVPSDT